MTLSLASANLARHFTADDVQLGVGKLNENSRQDLFGEPKHCVDIRSVFETADEKEIAPRIEPWHRDIARGSDRVSPTAVSMARAPG
jgi:hypothetical protein